jgi:PleD family two-component response regulator
MTVDLGQRVEELSRENRLLREELDAKAALAQQGYCVRIVDDDPETREVVSRTLRRAGYSTVEARDGEEALLRARRDLQPRIWRTRATSSSSPALFGM